MEEMIVTSGVDAIIGEFIWRKMDTDIKIPDLDTGGMSELQQGKNI